MGILHKQNEDVYNYILERFPIPEDFPYEIYRIGTKLYAFMIENNFNNYPKDVTGKYITSDPYRNGNIVMDEDVEEVTKEYALYALSKITYTVTLQARYPKVWKYIMNNYYIPEDYKYPVTKEMLKYMI